MYTRNRLDKIKEKKNIINVEHIRKKRLSFYMKTKQKSNDIYLKNKLESWDIDVDVERSWNMDFMLDCN
jgi:hypothetical protein